MISGHISVSTRTLTSPTFARCFLAPKSNTSLMCLQFIRLHSRISSSVSTAVTNTTSLPTFTSLSTKNLSTNSTLRIADMPPIAVDSWVVICDGDAAGIGHPREYIQLKKLNFHEPSTCKYCGLRYLRKGAHDFAHAHE